MLLSGLRKMKRRSDARKHWFASASSLNTGLQQLAEHRFLIIASLITAAQHCYMLFQLAQRPADRRCWSAEVALSRRAHTIAILWFVQVSVCSTIVRVASQLAICAPRTGVSCLYNGRWKLQVLGRCFQPGMHLQLAHLCTETANQHSPLSRIIGTLCLHPVKLTS
jgi:hypothetical protein